MRIRSTVTLQEGSTPDNLEAESPEALAVRAVLERKALRERKVAQTEVLDRASDPFRAVRLVIFIIFGVVGTAGCGVAISQIGSDPMNALGNLVVNAGVLGAGVGVYLFDRKIQTDLKAKLEEDLDNPYLKGGSEFFFEDSSEAPRPPPSA
uniref:Uncharacterized protein n=1 Tax=Coccolithus braarudii TaxID=221442 RepID=A0A7S0PXM2_9EUKA